MSIVTPLLTLALVSLSAEPRRPDDFRPATARAVKITVLSTMLADTVGIGEWGFAALVEVDGYRLLYDTGGRPETVLHNAAEMGIDLSTITDVVLSHHHGDHVAGLLTLRRALQAKNPAALSRAHVGTGIFQSRRTAKGIEGNPILAWRSEYEAGGGQFLEHADATELAPGVWLTGPVPRQFNERNWPKSRRLVTTNRLVEDSLPEDQALVVRTERGLVVLTGCGHAGIGNIMAYAQSLHEGKSVRAVLGGLHLLDADEAQLAWTAGRMRGARVQYLLGAHCTGLEALYRLRALAKLSRSAAVVGAVGSHYDDERGVDPGWLAH
jgi:7,8-dihydropterin-6-yl-methyl-4-(beta-D-ribofuranosyl)aminobenzene 5'-phosphate synthase